MCNRRQRANGPIHITVVSYVHEFENIVSYKIDSKETTWGELLLSNWIQIDPEKHCLKSADRKTVLLPYEKISSYLATFKKSWQEYKLVLTAITVADRKKIVEKLKKKRTGPRPRRSQSPKAGTSSAMKNEKGFQNSPQQGLNSEPEEPLFNFQQRFPEDFLNQNGRGAEHNSAGGENGQDFDDSASQDSQDSQVGLEDVKTAAITRLDKQTPNSVMYNVREEMRNLKRKPNFLKIARYIPLTINMLNYMFQES